MLTGEDLYNWRVSVSYHQNSNTADEASYTLQPHNPNSHCYNSHNKRLPIFLSVTPHCVSKIWFYLITYMLPQVFTTLAAWCNNHSFLCVLCTILKILTHNGEVECLHVSSSKLLDRILWTKKSHVNLILAHSDPTVSNTHVVQIELNQFFFSNTAQNIRSGKA